MSTPLSACSGRPARLAGSPARWVAMLVPWLGACGAEATDLVLEGVEPRAAAAGTDVAVTLHGDFPAEVQLGFDGGATRIDVGFAARLGDTDLLALRYVDPHTLTAVVPGGLLPGTYDLTLTGPQTAVTLAGAFTVSTAQGGTVSFRGAEQLRWVPLPSPVDPSNHLLSFNLAFATSSVDGSLISGQLSPDGAAVRFERSGGGAVDVEWTVLPIPGATVWRGAVDLGAGPTAVSRSLPVDVAQERSFAIHTWRADGGRYDWDAFVRTSLVDGTRLGFTRGVCCQGAGEWQVIELPADSGAKVQHGELILAAGVGEAEAQLEAQAQTDHSFLSFSYEVLASDSHDPPSAANHLVLGRLDGPDAVRFERDGAALPVQVSWSVVSWEALRTQHGVASFAVGETERRVPLAFAVDPGRALAFLPAVLRGGRTAHDADDAIGIAAVTTRLEDGGATLRLRRADARAAATAAWSVAEWSGLAAPEPTAP